MKKEIPAHKSVGGALTEGQLRRINGGSPTLPLPPPINWKDALLWPGYDDFLKWKKSTENLWQT